VTGSHLFIAMIGRSQSRRRCAEIGQLCADCEPLRRAPDAAPKRRIFRQPGSRRQCRAWLAGLRLAVVMALRAPREPD